MGRRGWWGAGASCSLLLLTAAAARVEESGGSEHPGTWLNWLLAVKVGGHPLVTGAGGIALAWSVVAIIILTVISVVGTRRVSLRPRGLQTLLEMAVGGLQGMVEGIMGPRGAEFTPFIGALFIYIALMNLLGMVPGVVSPTSNLNTTAGLAVMVFVVVQFWGLKERGFGYLKHFVAGVPMQFPFLLMAPLVFFIHVVGELMRPVTLALRLFGNIMGEETVVLSLIALVIPLEKRFIFVPVQLPNMLLGMVTAFVQALIFSMLAAVYLAGVMHEEHEEA